MVVLLEKQEKDPYETTTDEAADNSPEAVQRRLAGAGRGGNDGITNPKPPTIDWAAFRRFIPEALRTRQA